jgi:hypothetical protein
VSCDIRLPDGFRQLVIQPSIGQVTVQMASGKSHRIYTFF